jgi:tungstate transport system permease protein
METIVSIMSRSLYVSSIAALIAFAIAIAVSLTLSRLARRKAEMVLSIFEVFVGVPTTVIGVLLYMVFYPRGPLGILGILYTPYAIIIGEFLVALPIAVTHMFRHVYELKYFVRELVLSLGGSENQAIGILIKELIPIMISSYFLAFSRAIGELGVALIVGGGIEGYTNVLTTAIALQTSLGNYEQAIQLGGILIAITTTIAITLKILGEYIIWRLR